MGRRGLWLFILLVEAFAIGISAQRSSGDAWHSGDEVRTSLTITSPLGRTGLVTRVRIVAQVAIPGEVTISPVDFYVDGALVGTVSEGPPYAVDWTDDNPFERRVIVVQAADSTGQTIRDEVVLPAFEVEERAEVKSILVETGVYDKVGHTVVNVPPDAFSVREDGVDQQIDLVTTETVPTDVVLLVDNSQSMALRMDFVRRATEQVIAGLRPGDRAIVAPFNAHIGTITGPTTDARTIKEAIDSMQARGGTALLDSLSEASRLLAYSEGRRVLVLITDGYDENSKAKLGDAIRAVEETQATVYAVGIGGAAGIALKGEDTIRAVADASGGRAFFPLRAQDLMLAADAVSKDTHSRFLLTYTPKNQKKDGRWRAISVAVPGAYRVRARAGYYAPPPSPIRQSFEFSVFDRERRYVDVSKEDLDVFEEGVAQTVDTFQEAVDPVSIVLALDQSGSMKKSAELVKQTAREFVLAVRPEDSLAMILFADGPRFAHALATERKWSLDAIDKYTPLGGTSLYDALWNSLATLKSVKARRAVVVFTDGKDENNPGTAPGSVHTFDQVMTLAREVGANVFSIGLGPGVDRAVLQRLADETGGQAYFAIDGGSLSAQFHRVVGDLRRRYVLGYTSTNSTHNGAWRAVEIRPKTRGHYALSAGGYFAPAE